MYKTLTLFFDLDTLVIMLIGAFNFLQIDFIELLEYVKNPTEVLSFIDEIIRVFISLFSVLILYKKYKKTK